MIKTNFYEWVRQKEELLTEAASRLAQRDTAIIHPTDIQEGDVIINNPSSFFKLANKQDTISSGDDRLSTFRVNSLTGRGIGATATRGKKAWMQGRTKIFPSDMSNYLDVSDAFADMDLMGPKAGSRKTKYLLNNEKGTHTKRYQKWLDQNRAQTTTDPDLLGAKASILSPEEIRKDTHKQVDKYKKETGQRMTDIQNRFNSGDIDPQFLNFAKQRFADPDVDDFRTLNQPKFQDLIQALRFNHIPIAGLDVDPLSADEQAAVSSLKQLDAQLGAIPDWTGFMKPTIAPQIEQILTPENIKIAPWIGAKNVMQFADQAGIGDPNTRSSRQQDPIQAPIQFSDPKIADLASRIGFDVAPQQQQSQDPTDDPLSALFAHYNPMIGQNDFYFKQFTENRIYEHLPLN